MEEFDSRDRALVWRVSGGKHRYVMGDIQALVADEMKAFRDAAIEAMRHGAYDYLTKPLDLDEFLADFPTVSREQVEAFLERAKEVLLASETT